MYEMSVSMELHPISLSRDIVNPYFLILSSLYNKKSSKQPSFCISKKEDMSWTRNLAQDNALDQVPCCVWK